MWRAKVWYQHSTFQKQGYLTYFPFIYLSVYLSIYLLRCVSKKKIRERERNVRVGALSYNIFQIKVWPYKKAAHLLSKMREMRALAQYLTKKTCQASYAAAALYCSSSLLFSYSKMHARWCTVWQEKEEKGGKHISNNPRSMHTYVTTQLSTLKLLEEMLTLPRLSSSICS